MLQNQLPLNRPTAFMAAAATLFAAPSLLSHESAAPEPEAVYELPAYQVVSTATRTERLAADLPIRAETVTLELIRSSGATDLACALEYIPGVRTEANCQNCGTAEVKLLGLGAAYNQILFDSQPLFSGLASVYGLEQIPTTFIDRIEVVKGGASSLYGPGAVAGVINIVPAVPSETRIQGETTYASYKGKPAYSASLVADYATEERAFAASLYGQWSRNDAVDLNGDGFSEITEKRFDTVGINAWSELVDGGFLTLNTGYTSEWRRGGDRFDLAPHESQIAEQLEHDWHRGGLSWEHASSPDFAYSLTFAVSDVSRDSYYGGVGETALPGQLGYDESAYEAALQRSRLLYGYTESKRRFAEALFHHEIAERHTFSWGIQRSRDTVFDEKRDADAQPLRSDGSLAAQPGEDPIADDAFTLLGVMVQDEWRPNARWTVIGGLRGDKHSELEDWIPSPRLAVRHTVGSEWILRASAATGFRAPEIFDEDFHIEILDDPTRTRNGPGLTEERSLSTAAGFVWTPRFAQNRLQADVEFFRATIRDAFYVPAVVHHDAEGNAFKLRENAGGAVTQGAEANLLYRFTDRIKAEAGVSYVDARFDEAQEILPGVFERRFVESPRLSGVFQLAYENEAFLDAFVGVVYTGPMIAVEEVAGRVNERTQDFYAVDFTLARHIEIGEDGMHLDLQVGVRNALDARQPDLTSGPGRDTTYFYGPRLPRSFFARARVHF